MHSAKLEWPREGLTKVPFWIYENEEIYRRELRSVFKGPVWNFLCLEAEIPDSQDFVTTFAGETPVVVARDGDGEIYAFENRCSHRGALIELENSGRRPAFTCVYHAWSYDLQGNLTGIAFEKGVNGLGGMYGDFDKAKHSPAKLRVATLCGLVFGSFDDDVPTLEEYIGDEIVQKIQRVLHKPTVVLGTFSQMLPNNWKLYVENVKDSYHASLLHTFLTTFNLARFSQGGGLIVSEDGGNHVSYSRTRKSQTQDAEYRQQGLRSDNDAVRLEDPTFLEGLPEFDDDVSLQILSVFPGFVLQQLSNCIIVRQVLPEGVCSTRLNWKYLGFSDDTPQLRQMRLRQFNLVGPAGFVSMEDGCVGGFVQRGMQGANPGVHSVLQMGGADTESQNTRATEASVRGFWKAYRRHMEL
jgi:anthranilate 1,2-dioxygenase large subunit/terephthalate 1,2-dioxygenase oxygenase component alpha subunit